MNLRSVFTVEQQRILQRYYENGMTNQSKNCFQLILQCAQETKLDFSVVRVSIEVLHSNLKLLITSDICLIREKYSGYEVTNFINNFTSLV